MKARIKSLLIDAHCYGLMPAGLVRAVFRLLKLEGA